MKIEVSLKGDVFKILIDNLPHLYICEPISEFQSWNRNNIWWEIEISTKYNKFLLQYDEYDKWMSILKEMQKILI